MLAKLNTFALVGIEAVPVDVEVDVSAGLPKTILAGLPEAAVREGVNRIERALFNLGYERHPGARSSIWRRRTYPRRRRLLTCPSRWAFSWRPAKYCPNRSRILPPWESWPLMAASGR